MKHITTIWLLGLGLWAFLGLAQGADRFSYSKDGSEVTDNATGLVWRRCVEGMTWSGSSCTGSATENTHEAALQPAQAQTGGWRLPNIKELASIVDRSRKSPAIDPAAFPTTPPGFFWTSSPYVGNSDKAWFVDFYDGSVYGNFNTSKRYGSNYVRLVR